MNAAGDLWESAFTGLNGPDVIKKGLNLGARHVQKNHGAVKGKDVVDTSKFIVATS